MPSYTGCGTRAGGSSEGSSAGPCSTVPTRCGTVQMCAAHTADLPAGMSALLVTLSQHCLVRSRLASLGPLLLLHLLRVRVGLLLRGYQGAVGIAWPH